MTGSKSVRHSRRFEDSPDYVQSLDRGLQVIAAFDESAPRMTLTEVAGRTGLSRAVVRRQLLTLAHLGYVHQDGRSFSLTPRVLQLGYRYLSSQSLPELAKPVLQLASRDLHESCSLAVLDGTDIVYLQRVSVNRVMTINLAVGSRLPAVTTSMGRVLLAGLRGEELDQLLRQAPLRPFTPRSCVDIAALRKLIDKAGRDGYAYVEEELELGLCSMAVPVHDRNGLVIAAMNTGMSFRTGARQRARDEVLPVLRDAAKTLEVSLRAARITS